MADKVVVETDGAPAPAGLPYSQGVRLGDLIYATGQLPVDPVSGELIDEDEIRAQTDRVMRNIQAIVEAAGSSLENGLKATVYMADLADFDGMNEVYRRYVGERPPARTTFQVAALPLGSRVEIEFIAHA